MNLTKMASGTGSDIGMCRVHVAPARNQETPEGRELMDELTRLIEAVRKYRALRAAHAARWGEGDAWMRRSRPAAKEWDEYHAANGALVAAHKEVFHAALALGDAAPVEAGDVVNAPLRRGDGVS